MDGLLDSLDAAARAVVDEVRSDVLRVAGDDDLVAALAAVAGVQRLLDAVIVSAVDEVERRSSAPGVDDRLTHRRGCASVSELVQRVTRASAATAARWQRVTNAVGQKTTLHGDALDAALPALRAALLDGAVGVDGALGISGPLLSVVHRISAEELLMADAVLAATARGKQSSSPSADVLRVQAQAWAEALDRDGAEPREIRAARQRSLTLGRATEDGIPLRGTLMPEVAAQLQTIFDAVLNPRQSTVTFDAPDGTDNDVPPDSRTRPQRQHDALATALRVAASSGLLPTVGGAAPTLVVSVHAEDLAVDSGHADADGHSVSMTSARHVGCAGVIQRVTLGVGGRILRLGTEERVFNRHQRRAIALRDGGCVIPGCNVRAGWCEIHHVTEHAHGGPTHTDNGVLLCWYHHRFLDRSGWSIRMNRGVPEVRAPGWYDATLRWRTVTTSRTRLADAVLRR